jgi:hypothetical protein
MNLGRGTRDAGIVPEQILSATRNLNSGWNTNQNVPNKKFGAADFGRG